MEIVDIHAHVYENIAGITNGLPIVSRSYGKASVGNEEKFILPPSFLHSNSTVETLLAHMEYCGVSKAIMMANPLYGYHNVYVAKAAATHESKLKGVALVDVLKGQKAADELENVYRTTSLIGMKIEVNSTFQCAPDTRMTDKRLQPVWECCNAYAQPVFIHLFRTCDVEDFRTLANSYPNISFVACHLGADASFRQGGDSKQYAELLDIISGHANAYADTSTVPDYYEEEYPFQTSIEKIEQAYKTLGPEKLMWASDYPGMLNMATYKQLINLLVNGCKNIPATHKEWIMGQNANRLFFS